MCSIAGQCCGAVPFSVGSGNDLWLLFHLRLLSKSEYFFIWFYLFGSGSEARAGAVAAFKLRLRLQASSSSETLIKDIKIRVTLYMVE